MWVDNMESFIIGVMNNYGYLGIGLLILIENLFPPIPSEVILIIIKMIMKIKYSLRS